MKIVKIPLEDILEKGKERYNSNNHGDMPADYSYVLSQTHFSKFKHLKQYKTFELPIKNWMYEANKISWITGEFPNSYKEELDDYCKEYNHLNTNFDKPYFIRTESVSLKYGCYGNILYDNIQMLLKSIISCPHNHSPLLSIKNQKSLSIYLIDNVNINKNLEFRVFVYNKKITAISQQFIYTKNTYINNIIAEKIITDIKEFVYNNIIPNITHISNFTIDLSILNNNEIYFIELNSFGSEYAAGSALFHWEIDKDILYNQTSNEIEFRYVV
jgi:hypothetical protein